MFPIHFRVLSNIRTVLSNDIFNWNNRKLHSMNDSLSQLRTTYTTSYVLRKLSTMKYLVSVVHDKMMDKLTHNFVLTIERIRRLVWYMQTIINYTVWQWTFRTSGKNDGYVTILCNVIIVWCGWLTWVGVSANYLQKILSGHTFIIS